MDQVQTWLSAPASPPWAQSRAADRTALLKWLTLLAAGVCTNFTLELVGAFPVGEFVLAGALGVVALCVVLNHSVPGSLLRSRLLWTFIACQAVALLAYVASDISWGSTPNDMARGWARMIFLTVDILAVAFLFDVPDRPPEIGFVCFQVGYALGGALATLKGDVLFDDYWKFGWGPPVTIALLLLAPRAGFWLCQLACFALGLVHVALGFRSMGAICVLVPALMLFQRASRRERVLALGLAGMLALVVLASGRVSLSSSGEGGDVRSLRSNIERTAMVQAAWEGFQRSPWLGNGSWFSKSNVMQEFFALRYDKSMVAGIGSFGQDDGDAGFAIHSQILVALAEGGVLGGTFFLFYGAMLLWALGTLILTRPWNLWSNLCVFFMVLKLCDLATSPFSGFHRVLIAVAVGLVLLVWYKPPSHRGLASGDSLSTATPALGS